MSIQVELPPLIGQQAAAWTALMQLAPDMGTQWTLIGGQMVFLHQAEQRYRGSTEMRLTTDLDLVVNVRTNPSQRNSIHQVLTRHGFYQPPQTIEHRYCRDDDDVTIDVLAPDHLGAHLPRLGAGHTIQTPGGTQALRRTQWVQVRHAGRVAAIPRPNLIGAILIKQAAIASPGGRGPLRHRNDVYVLASMLSDGDIAEASLTSNERHLVHAAIADITAHHYGSAATIESLRQLAETPLPPRSSGFSP